MENTQPYDAIITLATRFDRLRSLTLHFDLILRTPLKSGRLILDSSDVRNIVDIFYSHRWRECNGSSSLNGFQKPVLKFYCLSLTDQPVEASNLFEGTFELRPPTDPSQSPQITLLEPEVEQGGDIEEVLRRRFSTFA